MYVHIQWAQLTYQPYLASNIARIQEIFKNSLYFHMIQNAEFMMIYLVVPQKLN